MNDEERKLEQAVDERDEAQQAISQIYHIVFGCSAEWSNNFGMDHAVEEITDAVNVLKTALAASQARVAELEAERDRWREDSMRQADTINRLAAAAEDRNQVDAEREKLHRAELEFSQTRKEGDASCVQSAEAITASVSIAPDPSNAATKVPTSVAADPKTPRRDAIDKSLKGANDSQRIGVWRMNFKQVETELATITAMEKAACAQRDEFGMTILALRHEQESMRTEIKQLEQCSLEATCDLAWLLDRSDHRSKELYATRLEARKTP